ncbi:MAG: hypothetical protein HY720_28945 [Planctomycetes bacterium]|nr:hypothetical protein [Planctomycetota bacterium]
MIAVEGRVEKGTIQLPAGVCLPENARVYVVIPDVDVEGWSRATSPRLVRPEEVSDFTLEVVELENDAGL